MKCPKCKSEKKVKNGQAHEKQRYKCKSCGCNYTKSRPRGKSKAIKRKALQLYLEGMGFAAIGRFLKVSDVSVMRWMRQIAREVRELRQTKGVKAVEIMELDEMWHYVKKKPGESGYGLLMIASEESPLRFTVEAVINLQHKSSGRE